MEKQSRKVGRMEPELSLNIKQTARLYGVSADTLRYYESIGLISPSRASNSYRAYERTDFGRLNIIMSMLNMNYTLSEIRSFLDNHTLETSFNLFNDELDSIDETINALAKRRRKIERCMQNISMALRAREEQGARIVRKEERPYIVISDDSLEGDSIPYATIKRLNELGMEIDSIHTVPCFILVPAADDEQSYLVAERTLLSFETGITDQSEFFPKGDYLCRTTAGPAEMSPAIWNEMQAFMAKKGLRAAGPLLEFWYVNEYISDNPSEFLHTLEIMVEPDDREQSESM